MRSDWPVDENRATPPNIAADPTLAHTRGVSQPLHIDTEIEIEAPIEEVWRALVDLAGYPSWNGYLVRVEGEAEPGTTLTVHSDMGLAEPLATPVLLVSLSPPHQMNWEGGFPDRSLFKGDHFWDLEERGEGLTHLRHHEFFTGKHAPDIAGGERTALIRGHFQRMNEDLKAHCERSTPG